MKLINAILIFQALLFPHGKDTSTTEVKSIAVFGGNEIALTTHPFCEYPDIAIDNSDNIFVVFTEMSDRSERVVAYRLKDTVKEKEFILSADSGNEFNPRISPLNKGGAVVVWAAKRNGNWDIFLRKIIADELSSEIKITNDEDVDLNPAIAVADDGTVFVVWERIEKGVFQIAHRSLKGDNISEIEFLSSGKNMSLRPTILFSKNKNLFVAWDEMSNGNYSVKLRKKKQTWLEEILVSAHYGFNQSPALAENKKGELFVVWSSDVNHHGEIEFNNWLHYRILTGEKFSAISTFAQVGDMKKLGEDQALEFPTLLFDQRDNLMIFSRPAQDFYLQFFNGKKLSELYSFGVKGWGGRGYHVRAAINSKGEIFSARRDLKNIALHKFFPKAITYSYPTAKIKLASDKISFIESNDEPQIRIKDDYKIVYGDIHQHSALSDGRGTIDECYTRSKYRYKYDFAALSDHEWFTQNLLLPSEWEWIKIIGKYFDSPTFITFAGYEWTTPRVPTGFGHKNVYFDDWSRPIFSFKFDAKTSLNLFQLLKENNAIAFPHHIGWSGIDWENHDEKAQPNFELVSTHGAFEFIGNEPIMHRGVMPGNFIQDGLAKGLKFGLIGSSDGHGLRWHHGVGRKEDEWQTGLTGALVNEVTKAEIFNALKSRRVFATSGAKIQIKFYINGNVMGTEFAASTPPEISFEALGTEKIHKVILVKNNSDYLQWGKDINDGRGVRGKFIDENIGEGASYYYLRIIQENGEMAWSSPIWVNYKK